MHKVIVFAGPSTYGLGAEYLLSHDFDWRPPVKRGDVATLVKENPASTLVICDGVFQAEPAVSHREICDALDSGWQVWGVSSLGAIRAAEMGHLGMRGFGYVYERFASDPDFSDDEACLVYFPESPYFPISEPLVNLRFAFESFGATFGITPDQTSSIISQLQTLWFGDRTQELVATLLRESGSTDFCVTAFMAKLQKCRRKQLDLTALLAAKPWHPWPHSNE